MRFSLFQPGDWEEGSTKAHEQWAEKVLDGDELGPKATNRRRIATNQRPISADRPEISD